MSKINHIKTFSLLLFFLPPALITGPFIPDLIISISAIYFFLYLILIKRLSFLKSDFSKIFFIFYLYIVLRSFFLDETVFSLKNTFFYFRFLLFSYLFKYLIINYKNFLNIFIKIFLITLIIISVDGIVEYFRNDHWLFNKISYAEFTNNNRISGFFDEEYIMGGFILTFFPTVLVFIKNTHNRKYSLIKYLFLSFCVALFIVAIIVSGERATLIKLSILIILLIFFTPLIDTAGKRLIVFFSLIVIIFITIISQPTLKERLLIHTINLVFDNKLEDKIDNDTSIIDYLSKKNLKDLNIKYFSKEHQDHAIVSLRMFNDKKIFGHGIKMFRFK